VAALQFEPWFYFVAGEIYAEHGHQFDPTTRSRTPLAPNGLQSRGPMLALPMGNLSNRYLMPRMGFFNPHARTTS